MLCILPIAFFDSQAAPQSKETIKQDFATLSAQADAARASEQLREAVILYHKALALRPTWSEGWWSLGMVQYVQHNYAEGALAFRKVLALKAGDGTANIMLGLCEFELGHDESALRDIEEGKRIGLAPDAELRDVMRYHEGILLLRLGKFEAAREILNGLCADRVHTQTVVNGLGMVALRMRDRNPPSQEPAAQVVTSVGQATCLAAQDKLEQARQAFAGIVQQYPNFPNIHYAYGRFLREAHDSDVATREFEQEIKNNPTDVIARLQIADVKYRVDSAGGLPYAEEAVKLEPRYPFGHYVLGLLLLDTGDYQRAIAELETARRAFPHQEQQVYFALGTAYAHVGRKQDAERARAIFARLQKQHPSTHSGASGETGTSIPE